MTRDFLMVGDHVDLRIGQRFLPNQTGAAIEINDRHDGELVEWNSYGTAEVLWPNGEQYSYEPALLVRR